jgi:eukaryotic-like serine/threonine-protein kinase
MPHAPDLSGCALDDRYELHAIIGEGAFGRVYEGRDRRLDRPVAVKVIKPWWAEDPEWVDTFARETRILAQVSDPGIVQIYDVGHADEGLYYVSELVQGENLAARLRRGPLPAWEACGLAAQLCRALARAHAQRIVHRDIKPANILLSTDGRVKVGDFGVARLAEGSSQGTSASIVGTPRYMAPEQGRGRPTTPATDVYSVGVVLYEMLSGAPPFTASSVVELALLHLQDPPPPLSARLPTSLVEIVDRALSKDPAQRYADGAQMAEALQDARERPTGVQRTARAATTRARTRTATDASRRPMVGAAAGGSGSTSTMERPSASVEPPIRPAPRGPHGTRRVAPLSPRRNANPAARRRAAAALGLVITLLGAMVVAALVIGRTTYTHIPALMHKSEGGAFAAARQAHVKLTTSRHHSMAPPRTVIAQSPRAGQRVATSSTVHITLSSGPAPVPVVNVRSQTVADAEKSLRGLGLRTAVTQVPAPGTTPGTVVGQDPAGGTTRPRGSTVALSVAEVPQWRTATTFDGRDSGIVHIRGEHWRVVYRMGFKGTCTWILFCSGPTARVVNAATGRYVAGFGLQNGSGQVQGFTTGPGAYDIQVTPGGDDAGWSVQVQDNY